MSPTAHRRRKRRRAHRKEESRWTRLIMGKRTKQYVLRIQNDAPELTQPELDRDELAEWAATPGRIMVLPAHTILERAPQ